MTFNLGAGMYDEVDTDCVNAIEGRVGDSATTRRLRVLPQVPRAGTRDYTP